MTTSGTTTFDPSLGSLTIYAFGLCGLRPAELIQEHMESARMASGLLLGRWSSQQVPLWKVDQITVPLVSGTATYSVPSNTITMLDAYVTTNTGTATQNRIILPISRTEYASYPNPTQTGAVTVFWFNRLLSPTVTLYLVPDGTQPTLVYYRIVQIDDAAFTSGQTVDIPFYFLEAFALGLAARLAVIWAPDRAPGLKALADEAWAIATDQNVEASQVYVSPMVAGYWRA